jgi:hypothetical protein
MEHRTGPSRLDGTLTRFPARAGRDQRDARDGRDGCAAGDPGRPPTGRRAAGRTVYTPLLNDRGGYEADVTITRLRFASSAAFGHAVGRTVLLGYAEAAL